MTGAYHYKPKFRDMRIRPPKADEEERARDVHALREGEVECDWPGCRTAGVSRAPKARDLPHEHYWFCTPHAAEYNKSWDYFSGMSEGQIAATVNDERQTGGRPTWAFRASNKSRESAAFAAGKYRDPMGLFGAPGEQAKRAANDRRLGKIESRALADMDLDVNADKAKIRARYTELLKRLHPDANGGDRTTEERLQRVIKAYKALKAARLV
jgi:curved DNA-binding protein CbpA